MPDHEIVDALADAFEAAAQKLRERSALLQQAHAGGSPAASASETNPGRSAVERARALHPQLGPRQAEVIHELAKAGAKGTGTGPIVKAIDYDQPDVYLTLKGLQALGFAEKDTSSKPHTYRLGQRLRDERWPRSAGKDVA
jgi:hypothetical protein